MRGTQTTLAVALLATLGTAPTVGLRSEPIVVTGRVTSVGGTPVFGANISVEALTIRVASGADGRYVIRVPAERRGETHELRVRGFGYLETRRTIVLSSDTVVADFALRQDAQRLSQVVVTGVTGASATRKLPFSVSGAGASNLYDGLAMRQPRDLSGESYAVIEENPLRSPLVAPLSTFGVDVDRASYANVRRYLTVDHQRPPRDAVRIEEMLNYFAFAYPPPTDGRPFAVHSEVSRAPWAPSRYLVRIGLQAPAIDFRDAPPSNLVFLIDVSGSMSTPDKLPLLKGAFRMLVDKMREQDRIAIVVYAGAEGLALPSTSGAEKERILDVLDELESGGSTAGAAGIELAYRVAREHFVAGGNNRVILATDGDFNVGVTSLPALKEMVETRRAEGTALSVLGFGAGNIQDDRMEMLANTGNGAYNYIDSALEAQKVLVREIGGTIVTVAKDVKLQVEFNPAVVAAYRLIGYENRLLEAEDFADDRKDAGDIGAGHSVTALYEIVPVGSPDAASVALPDSLRYTARGAPTRNRSELMYVRLRYKLPTDSTSVPMDVVVPHRITAASEDFRFAQAVAAFALLLRESPHAGTASEAMVLSLARGALGEDRDGYRAEFVRLVTTFGEIARVASRRR